MLVTNPNQLNCKLSQLCSVLSPAEILFAWFSAIGCISGTNQILRLNEDESRTPWKPILFASLSSKERSATSWVLFLGEAHTEDSHSDTLKCAETQTLKRPLWEQCPSRLCKISKWGRPSWH